MKVPNWLRWVGVLPCSIVAYFLIYAVMKLIGMISSIWGMDADDYSWFFNFSLPLAASGYACYYYLKAGYYIAPKYKLFVAALLTIPMGCMLLFSTYMQFYRFQIKHTFEIIGGVIGLIMGYKQLSEHDKLATDLSVPILSLTDNQYNAVKAMYGDNITREDALKKVNEVRAFKSLRQH